MGLPGPFTVISGNQMLGSVVSPTRIGSTGTEWNERAVFLLVLHRKSAPVVVEAMLRGANCGHRFRPVPRAETRPRVSRRTMLRELQSTARGKVG